MKTPEGDFSANPVIRLIENREVIEQKLDEYKSRLNSFGSPETQLDTVYKIAVAQKLVDIGEVNTHDLSLELAKTHGFLDVDTFNNACGVIVDYINTGGKNLYGGTGLDGSREPKHRKSDDNGGGRVM